MNGSNEMLRLAWYGDDFTGASDTLATLATAGWRVLLFTQVPDAAQLGRAGPLDALGIAGTARALAPAAMRQELEPVRALFDALQPRLTHYKCCSTFDSAPQVGNLAVGLQVLRGKAHQAWVPIIGGQPSLGRYCAFGELYACAANGGEVHRIDRHPTMSRHPVTPMHEADLRRHLAEQGLERSALIDLRLLDEADDQQLEAALDSHLAVGPEAVLFDATRGAHLARIGRILWQRAAQQPLLALGASSVAQALIAHWQQEEARATIPLNVLPASGPVFLLAGSQSPVTAAQVQEGAGDYELLDLPAQSMVASPAEVEAIAARCAALLAAGRSVLARTTSVGWPAAAPLAVAEVCGRLLARVLELAPHVRRIGVAGGDTSSFALRALAPWALSWAGTLAPGVHLLRTHADVPTLDGLELMLKGGQMGSPDVFQRLIRGCQQAVVPV